MTAKQLELRKKIENNISKFSESELQKMLDFSERLMFAVMYAQAYEKAKENQDQEEPKKVLYNGMWLTENTVKLMTWHKPIEDTDDEVNEKIWEYLKEKYK